MDSPHKVSARRKRFPVLTSSCDVCHFQGYCVEPSSCPCYYNGAFYDPGEVITVNCKILWVFQYIHKLMVQDLSQLQCVSSRVTEYQQDIKILHVPQYRRSGIRCVTAHRDVVVRLGDFVHTPHERYSVWNHWQTGLSNQRNVEANTKKTPKLHIIGPLWREPPSN